MKTWIWFTVLGCACGATSPAARVEVPACLVDSGASDGLVADLREDLDGPSSVREVLERLASRYGRELLICALEEVLRRHGDEFEPQVREQAEAFLRSGL